MPTIAADAPVIETARLRLRPPDPSDAEDLFEAARSWEVARYTARMPHPYPRQEADRFVAATTELWRNGGAAQFIVRERVGDAFVGMCGVEFDADEAVLGYFIAHGQWGKGYGGEAARAVVAYAFDARGIDRLRAAAVPENAASHKILARLGMTRGEKVLEDAPARDAPNWVYRYVLTAAAWRERESES
jgi:RimJ/RimL family protein N-acetyltransferase